MDFNQLFEILIKLLIVAGLVFLNGFFVASEFALVKIRSTQLQPLIARGNKRAKIAKFVLENLDSSLSACQLGITIASLALGWVGEPVFKVLLKPLFELISIQSTEAKETIAVIVGFTTITFLHITAGEQSPKWIAIQKPLQTSLWVAAPLRLFHIVMFPFIWLLNKCSLYLIKLIGLKQIDTHEGIYSEDELRLLFATYQKDSRRTPLGREIVLNALDLSRRVVRDVMRPRKEIVFFDVDEGIEKCIEIAEKTKFSRYPICENGDIDKTLGFVHIKDLYLMKKNTLTARGLLSVARKLIYVPPTARLEKLLHLFLQQKVHMAIVVDEYGGTLGIVTLENVLEEIVGQIQDEFDQEKPLINRISENEWELNGLLPLYELSELVNQTLTAEGVSTVGGWVTHQLGGFPKKGDVINIGNYRLQVLSMDGIRVEQVKLWKEPKLTMQSSAPEQQT